MCCLLIRSQAGSVRLTGKQGQVVRKWVGTNQLNNKFFLYTNVFHCFCVVYFETIQAQNRRLDNIQKTSLQSYKT